MLYRIVAILAMLASQGRAQQVEDRPHVFGCGQRAFAGQTLCICGNFPTPSADSLLLDGKPLGRPMKVSQNSLTFQIPEKLPPGLHVVTGMPEAGFSPSEAVVTTLLELAPEIDQKAMLTGQWTRARFRVRGTTARVDLRITNRTPNVIAIEGGAEQTLVTSGGLENFVNRRVHALFRGDFSIGVELAGDTCPCATAKAIRQAGAAPAPPAGPVARSSEDPRGFLSARVLALIPLAARGAMAATAQALAVANGLNVAEVVSLTSSGDGLVVFTIPDASDVLVKVAALNADPRVRFAEPDFLFDTDAASAQNGDASGLKYGARLIGLDQLGRSLTGKDVSVAVIDTGADTGHPLLAGRIKLKSDVTATPYKPAIHGTFVAGIIADLAPRASLLSIQACLPYSEQSVAARCSTVSLTKALNLAIEKHARVINLSLGGPASRTVERMIAQAVRSSAMVVAAAGNGGANSSPPFPAVLETVVAVTAVDVERSQYSQATRGSFIDLAAPGVDILSAAPGGQLLILSGTSAAAPHASAVAALMFEKQRTLSPIMAQEFLERAAVDLGRAGKDPDFGSGLVDACRTIAQLSGNTPLCR